MKLTKHTVRQYADVLLALLPPGMPWKWPLDGFGDKIFQAVAVEFTRIEDAIQDVLDRAITLHTPKKQLYTLAEYQRVAEESVESINEDLSRRKTRVGSMRCGRRLWSEDAEGSSWVIPKVRVAHLLGPIVAGRSVCGRRLAGERARYVMRVFYYYGVVDPDVIANALKDFRQAHVVLFFEDITGFQGNIYYA